MNYQRVVKDLEADEGIRLRPYKDHLGFWTIGMGNRKILGEEVTASTQPLKSVEVAYELAYADMWQATLDAQEWLGVDNFESLRGDRQEVIVQMSFQLGLTTLRQFKNFRSKLLAGDYAGAADNMRNSLWARQTPKRVERLAKIMESSFPRS